MRVLFLHANSQDYMAESLIHGLRTLLGSDCVDVPRYDSLYAPLPPSLRARLRGGGFTLYGLLPELPELATARFCWKDDIHRYDLVVVADVWRCWEWLWHPAVRSAWRKVVVVDGADGPAFFPFAAHLWKWPWAYVSGALRRPYFKREFCESGLDYGFLTRLLPVRLRRVMPPPRRGRTTAFSIPAEKLSDFTKLEKTRDFPRYVVDAELAAVLLGSWHTPVGGGRQAFADESDYYSDLRQSRFGITTRRAGWDCLRHYELAANGCILCFRDLQAKPPRCAPHGLGPANSITYRNAKELLTVIKSLSPGQYADLLAGTDQWARTNTTAARAREFLEQCG